jgi:hypothetical protein
MEIAGEIGIFENQKACGPLRKHLFGAKRFAQWWFVAAMLAGDILVSTLIEKVALGYGWLGVMLFTIAALFFWLRYARRLGPKAWMARGVPAVSPITYRIEDAGLVLDSQTSMTRVAWSGMSQIAPGNAAWLFIGPGQAWFLPTRFFADRQQERAFLTACFDRLTPEAKARSSEVAALVAAEAGPWGVAPT